MKHEAQPGDILLFYHAEGVNRIIAWFSKSLFYHVGLYAGDGRTLEARPRGVVHRDLGKGEAYFVVIPAPQDKGRAALAWGKQHIGDGYSPLNVLALVLDRVFAWCQWNITLPHQFSCGDFVVQAFAAVDVTLFPDRQNAIAPWDFACLLPRSASEIGEIPQRPFSEEEPLRHTIQVKAILNDIVRQLRVSNTQVTEPKAQALFETSAEVLKGLLNAFDQSKSPIGADEERHIAPQEQAETLSTEPSSAAKTEEI